MTLKVKLFPPTTLRHILHLSLKPKKPDSVYQYWVEVLQQFVTVTWVLQVSERSVYYLKLQYLLFSLLIFLNHTLNFRFFPKNFIKFLGCILYTRKYGMFWSTCHAWVNFGTYPRSHRTECSSIDFASSGDFNKFAAERSILIRICKFHCYFCQLSQKTDFWLSCS